MLVKIRKSKEKTLLAPREIRAEVAVDNQERLKIGETQLIGIQMRLQGIESTNRQEVFQGNLKKSIKMMHLNNSLSCNSFSCSNT
jgi:hypothetical protein